jgi:hypothetical protein
MKNVTVKAGVARYMSEIPEFKDGLPEGIIAKGVTDAGGTMVTLLCDGNYIIVCPTIDLVDSIVMDTNNKYKVLAVKGGVDYSDFINYATSNSVHKIAVTYNSLPKLKRWIEDAGYDISTYPVLVDEYHLLLEDIGFRERAIFNLTKTLSAFPRVSYMSATPINDSFSSIAFPGLAKTKVIWDKSRIVHIKPLRIKTPNVYKATVKTIDMFKAGKLSLTDYTGKTQEVKQLYIFMNTVSGIAQVVKTAKLDESEVKVVCSDNIRNKLVLGDIVQDRASSPDKSINFFTKKSFQGCNMFSNNALVIVVSDGNKKHTLVDIQTSMYQIVGRLRSNATYDNCFKNTVWHIFSTARKVQDITEFHTLLDVLRKETRVYIKVFNSLTPIEKTVLDKYDPSDGLLCALDRANMVMEYVPLKEAYMIYQYELSNHIYKTGANLLNSYKNNGYDVADKQIWTDQSKITLEMVTTVDFKRLIKLYIDLHSSLLSILENYETIDELDREYPIFLEAITILKPEGIATCKYQEASIRKALVAKHPDMLNSVFTKFHGTVGNGFISSAKAKEILSGIYTELCLTTTPVPTVLKECKWLEVTDSVVRDGSKLVRGFNIKAIDSK